MDENTSTPGVYCGNCMKAFPLEQSEEIEDGCPVCTIPSKPLPVPDVTEANNGRKKEYHQKWLEERIYNKP